MNASNKNAISISAQINDIHRQETCNIYKYTTNAKKMSMEKNTEPQYIRNKSENKNNTNKQISSA